MAQETYLIAKSVLKRVKSPSDAQPLDFFSPSALVACSRAAQNLQHLSITSEEQEILEKSKSIEGVKEFIAEFVAEVDKKRHHNKAWKKVYAFSKFAGPVLDVFKQANFSPECSVALGLVGMLLIQPLNNKSEIEERLEAEIGQLEQILSQVKFSKSNINTMEMNSEIQGLCAAIIDFLVHALHYQKKWGIVKVLSSIIADFAKRFQSFVTKIRGHATKIEVLAQRGYTTVLLDSKEILDRTAQTIQDLQAHAVAQAAIFELRTARLEDEIAQCRKAIETSNRLPAILHTQKLCAALLPNLPDFEQEILFIRQQELLLAPRERWEYHVSEIQAPGWLSKFPRPILWIGGNQNRRGVSWVSSFALDLVEALEMERGAQVVYTLCNGDQKDVRMSPLIVFERVITQLLKAFPELVIVPENLDRLSLQRFHAVKESPEAAYKILADILKMIDAKCQLERKEMFLLIDRVDVVLMKENSQGRQRFVRALKQLITEYKSLRIVATSQFTLEEMELAKEGKESVTEVWVDTSKPLAMYSRQ